MFRVSLHGRIHSHGEGVVTVHAGREEDASTPIVCMECPHRPNADGGSGVVTVQAPHHEHGYRDPISVLVYDPSTLLNPARFPEGSKVWVHGDGFQYRDDEGLTRLGIYPSAVTGKLPTSTSGSGAVTAVVHGKISSDISIEQIKKGARSGRWVCRFSVHVQVPEMDNGVHVVLRCLMQGDKQAMYLGRRHQKGDRVNLAGDLMELRFAERETGQQRTSHELRVRRWTYAKDPWDDADQTREVVSHRVVERPIGEALCGNGGKPDAARGRGAPVPGYATSGGGETLG